MKKIISFLVAIVCATVVNAQIGYQVSLLKSATGEPRANETVNCTVTLSNCEGSTIYTGTQHVVTNEFGVASLTVGDAKTFDKMDWTKLPLFVEVSVDGKTVGKTQVLSVPVAEYAKKAGGGLTYEKLKTITVVSPYLDYYDYGYDEKIENGIWSTYEFDEYGSDPITTSYTVFINSNVIYFTRLRQETSKIRYIGLYDEESNTISVYRFD